MNPYFSFLICHHGNIVNLYVTGRPIAQIDEGGADEVAAFAKADDTVKVVLHNPTTAAIAVVAGTARALVFPSPGNMGGLEVYFTWVQSR